MMMIEGIGQLVMCASSCGKQNKSDATEDAEKVTLLLVEMCGQTRQRQQ